MKQKILNWYEKYCYSHKIDSAVFDIDSEIDSNITFDENIAILEEKLRLLSANGTLDKENFKQLKAQKEEKDNKIKRATLNSLRILNNSLSLVIGKTNTAKTSFLCELIKDYTANFNGTVFAYGLKESLIEKLKIKQFSSLIEMEKIRDSIIIVDECRKLFDLEDRKMTPFIDSILRLVSHNNNKLVLAGLPSDFKKYICAKADCFCYKSLDFTDLINGSRAKEIIGMYKGEGKGSYTLDFKLSEVLVYDGKFEIEEFLYNSEWDTKINNVNLFAPKCAENAQKVVEDVKNGK